MSSGAIWQEKIYVKAVRYANTGRFLQFDKMIKLTYNILNKEPVSQSKAGHLVFELQLKNSASTFHG